MYARSTTIHGDPMRIDETIAYIRDEVMPVVKKMAGCTGLSMLCDRENGRCIITTAWRDEASMHDTEGAVHDMRQRAAEMLGGRAEVKEWEIALMHRMHEAHNGARTRVIWTSGEPDRMNDQLDTFRMSLLPKMEDLPGFCAVSLMVDRDSGRAAIAVTYDSPEDMRRANERATALRQEYVSGVGMEIMEMEEFDLSLAHLRVPEMV